MRDCRTWLKARNLYFCTHVTYDFTIAPELVKYQISLHAIRTLPTSSGRQVIFNRICIRTCLSGGIIWRRMNSPFHPPHNHLDHPAIAQPLCVSFVMVPWLALTMPAGQRANYSHMCRLIDQTAQHLGHHWSRKLVPVHTIWGVANETTSVSILSTPAGQWFAPSDWGSQAYISHLYTFLWFGQELVCHLVNGFPGCLKVCILRLYLASHSKSTLWLSEELCNKCSEGHNLWPLPQPHLSMLCPRGTEDVAWSFTPVGSNSNDSLTKELPLNYNAVGNAVQILRELGSACKQVRVDLKSDFQWSHCIQMIGYVQEESVLC